jgi:hypothetical protein
MPGHEKHPRLRLTKVDFDYPKGSVDYTFIRPKIINALPDGGQLFNRVVFNRQIGLLGGLQDDLSQLALDMIQPFVIGRIRPEMDEESLERRHWPIVWIQPPMLNAPIKTDNYTAAWSVGLRGFSGPHYWLCTPEDFIHEPHFEYIAKEYIGKDDEGNSIYEDVAHKVTSGMFLKPDEQIGSLFSTFSPAINKYLGKGGPI